MKTDFEARPAFVRLENRIKAHFQTWFLALLVYRILEKKLGGDYTCEEILKKLREMDFADVEEQGYLPLYRRSKLTDALHEVCGFHTDYQFITRQKMRESKKEVKAGNKLPYFNSETEIAVAHINTGVTAVHRPYYC